MTHGKALFMAVKTYPAGEYDAAVIGLGHAGIEAALALARLGLSTAAFAINLDSVGNMPCNPAIGGTAKGHLVRELDALGGEMGKAADACCIEYRMLNRGKGPAVYSLRGQIDRVKYREHNPFWKRKKTCASCRPRSPPSGSGTEGWFR